MQYNRVCYNTLLSCTVQYLMHRSLVQFSVIFSYHAVHTPCPNKISIKKFAFFVTTSILNISSKIVLTSIFGHFGWTLFEKNHFLYIFINVTKLYQILICFTKIAITRSIIMLQFGFSIQKKAIDIGYFFSIE